MASDSDKNGLVLLLAGFGLGVILGAVAGLLFAPKAGPSTREDIGHRFKDLKHKTEEWVAEQKAKRASKAAGDDDEAADAAGA